MTIAPGDFARWLDVTIETEVDDALAAQMAREIAAEIEDSLEYPGQIKVTVIRESRASELAR